MRWRRRRPELAGRGEDPGRPRRGLREDGIGPVPETRPCGDAARPGLVGPVAPGALDGGRRDPASQLRAGGDVAREGDAGKQAHPPGFVRHLREARRPLREDIGQDFGRDGRGHGVLLRPGWARRRRADDVEARLDHGGPGPVVGVLAVPGRDHRVRQRRVQDGQVPPAQVRGQARAQGFLQHHLVPAIGGRHRVPPGDALARRGAAVRRQAAELRDLRARGGLVGRRRQAELAGGGEYPGAPGTGIRLSRLGAAGRLRRGAEGKGQEGGGEARPDPGTPPCSLDHDVPPGSAAGTAELRGKAAPRLAGIKELAEAAASRFRADQRHLGQRARSGTARRRSSLAGLPLDLRMARRSSGANPPAGRRPRSAARDPRRPPRARRTARPPRRGPDSPRSRSPPPPSAAAAARHPGPPPRRPASAAP